MKVFVYGSLKKNKKLHHYLKNSRFLGYATTKQKHPMIISVKGWYPYLLDVKNMGFNVKGEVYEINFRTLRRLDRIEETPHYYRRKKITVLLKGRTVKVWVYVYPKKKYFLKKEIISEF